MKTINLFVISFILGGILFAQPDRWDGMKDDDRGRMEMYAIWKLTETLDLDEKQAEVFFPKLNKLRKKLRKLREIISTDVEIWDETQHDPVEEFKAFIEIIDEK